MTSTDAARPDRGPDSPNPVARTPQPSPEPLTAAPNRAGLVRAGGWPFLITSFIGRVPASTLQLGLLLYVSSSGLGLGLAGLTIAAIGVGSALSAPMIGRLADRYGPLPVIATATVVQVLGLAGMYLVVNSAAPAPAVLACAALVGFANPQTGPIARAHWSRLAREQRAPDLIRVALGYESAVDELGFILGPVLASLLVGLLGPNPALLVMASFTVLGQGLFLAYLATSRAGRSPRGETSRADTGSVPLPWAGIWSPVLSVFAAGMTFGATQTALTAVFEARGRPELTGLVYGCVGIGSAAASLLIVRLPRTVPLGVRVLGGGVLVLAGGLAMTTLPGVGPSIAVNIMLGLGVGSIIVSSYTRMEQIAPDRRLSSMMTMLATGLTLGISAGAAVAGWLAVEPAHGFWPTAAAGVLAILAGLSFRFGRPRA